MTLHKNFIAVALHTRFSFDAFLLFDHGKYEIKGIYKREAKTVFECEAKTKCSNVAILKVICNILCAKFHLKIEKILEILRKSCSPFNEDF